MFIRPRLSISKHSLLTSHQGADRTPLPDPVLCPISHRISQIPASLISFGDMALYLPPASSRTSVLILPLSSSGAKMTPAVLKKRCIAPKSTTVALLWASTSRLGKPNSTLVLLRLYRQDYTPDSVRAPPLFLKVLYWWVGTSLTLAPRTHCFLVLPITATDKPTISALALDAWWLTSSVVSQQPFHARPGSTSPIRTRIRSRFDKFQWSHRPMQLILQEPRPRY